MSETVISSVFICPKCKYTNPSKSKFCMQCGNPLSSENTNIAKKPKIVLVENGKPKKDFLLSEKVKIGKGNDIDIKGSDFSENICEIKIEGEKIFLNVLVDEVFIKANTNKPLELNSGSEIRIGDNLFRVEI
jgi:hypothetical protein